MRHWVFGVSSKQTNERTNLYDSHAVFVNKSLKALSGIGYQYCQSQAYSRTIFVYFNINFRHEDFQRNSRAHTFNNPRDRNCRRKYIVAASDSLRIIPNLNGAKKMKNVFKKNTVKMLYFGMVIK